MTDNKRKTFHVCQSISGLENLMKRGKKIEWLMIDDRPATVFEIQDAIRDAKSKGYEVLPPCNNVTSKGHCAGHDVKEKVGVEQHE